MNIKQSIVDTTSKVSRMVYRKSPELLAGSGIALFFASIVSAIKVTPKANDILKEKKQELKTEELPVKEVVKSVGKLYLPTVATSIGGVACIAASVTESNKRYLALGTSYELLREASNIYREKVIETIGEKKESRIRNAVSEEEVKKNQPTPNVNIYAPKEDGQYKTLFFEPITKRYFWESRPKVEMAIQKAYREIRESFENTMSVYTWLSFLPSELTDGLPDGYVDTYMDMGWSMDDPYDVFVIDIYSAGEIHGGEYDGYPALALSYSQMPTPAFRSGY